jgi:hypothetical protein
MLQGRQGRRTEFVPGVGTAQEGADIVPTSKRATAKAQPNFPDLRDGMDGDRTWGKHHDWIESGAQSIE